MDDAFLKLASKSTDSSFASDAIILERLQSLKKSVIISAESTQYIEQYYLKIKNAIENQKSAYLYHYYVDSTGISNCEELSSVAETDEGELLNYVMDKFEADPGYVFVVDRGFQCLFVDGKVSCETKNCLSRHSTMQEQLNSLEPVSGLPYIFELYNLKCSYGLNYCDCFCANGKIRAEILEQELRNFLLRFLKSHVKGTVETEFCTDYENDEESVDIYLNDAKETAIIEVKFAFSKKNYEGKTNYDLNDRANKGYQQLDKYAEHLAKDDRHITYGYLYIFHMIEKESEQVKKEVDAIFASTCSNRSAAFNSLYTETRYNDMHEWNPKKSLKIASL